MLDEKGSNMSTSYVDGEKVLESLVYITNHNIQDVWKALKLLFYAEKIHMERFGQPITGDIFIAMDQGPVPSFAYDLIKEAQGNLKWEDPCVSSFQPKKVFHTYKNFVIKPKRPTNLEVLSESAIEALTEAINTYGTLTDEALSKLAHSEECYVKTPKNHRIADAAYLDWLQISSDMREYISS